MEIRALWKQLVSDGNSYLVLFFMLVLYFQYCLAGLIYLKILHG